MRFSAPIFKLGINPCVDVPARIMARLFLQAQKEKGPISVRGSLNGSPFQQTLVKFRGKWRLYINRSMLEASGLTVGRKAALRLRFDPVRRTVPMHPQLRQALAQNQKAKDSFEALPPSRRREILRYLHSLKTSESVLRNVRKVISRLTRKN